MAVSSAASFPQTCNAIQGLVFIFLPIGRKLETNGKSKGENYVFIRKFAKKTVSERWKQKVVAQTGGNGETPARRGNSATSEMKLENVLQCYIVEYQ